MASTSNCNITLNSSWTKTTLQLPFLPSATSSGLVHAYAFQKEHCFLFIYCIYREEVLQQQKNCVCIHKNHNWNEMQLEMQRSSWAQTWKDGLGIPKSFCLGMPISLVTNNFSFMLPVLHKLNFWKLTELPCSCYWLITDPLGASV